MHEFGVVIGRFQPFHNAHYELVKFALKQAQKLIIVLGSDNQARTIKNPWTSDERSKMIRNCLTAGENERVEFLYARDYLYNNLLWVAAVQKDIDEITGGSCDVKLIGHKKDASSFYLKLFPQWGEHIESGINFDIDASKIRECIFRKDTLTIKAMLPPAVYEFMESYMATSEYQRLYDERQEVLEDKEAWRGSPYQPIFVTTDAVVLCSGHCLVVRRKGRYGRGLIALPGGYVNANEMLMDSCIRELKEETGIKVPAQTLKECVKEKEVFDHPGRDLRGRLITHAFCIKLPDGELPKVKGMDDADKAWWMSIRDVQANEQKFFADHFHIIEHFVSRYRDQN